MCNGAPVATCSNAVISITVYPNIVANNDVINTTPLTSTTGSLLTNDIGIVPGGNYVVSVTPPLVTVGSITVNPSTGQYTFAPALTFSGTSQTTYTVCNAGVNPQQCSSATITINVTSLPTAADDGTTTTINTPVSGNVGTNDSGTLGGIFTFSTTSPATGTLIGNILTGQYLFTPATGFTGTTSTTYTLCNLSSPPCSTATITFTVYPDLIANTDIINTTPSVTATGTLLANDTGITPGANYLVSVTQPPTSDGTITINPATGEYTFVPDPTFTGDTQATYTVCNTSVNPQQCSSTTINIHVKPTPVAFDDAISTLINFSVSGNVAINDQGTATGTFAIVNQPANGTITINSSTGQFTFTPATGFTGITTATYNLCNGAPTSCSSATITITVYPNLTANPDAIVTTPSISTTGSLLANDSGITAGANYTVSATQLPPSTGTLVINSVTGQYTFIPNPSFIGLAQTNYTVCIPASIHNNVVLRVLVLQLETHH